jgi:hypothetical protein
MSDESTLLPESGGGDADSYRYGRGIPRRSEPIPYFPGLEVMEELAPGVGGMGVIYKAREPSLDRFVAVKMIRGDRDSPAVQAFFQREAAAAAQLDHPNILQIHRFSPEHNPPFFVMQYVDGRPLDVACAGRDFSFIASQIEKIAGALEYAHERGIVHRDIKPSNVLVDRDDQPHVADFGLAGRLEAPGDQNGSIPGTPICLAPELYDDPAILSPAIDIYALGVTMYRLLTGRYPFVGKDPQSIQESALRGAMPMPQEINPAIPEPLQRICLKAMERDPLARYETAGVMADDLRRFRVGAEVYARPTRYASELRGKLQNFLTDLRLWHEQRLIDLGDYDRLARPARTILAAPYPWHQLSRRFPWETILLRLGGWLVVITSVLWVAFYWPKLGTAARGWTIGLPTLATNAVGWILFVRGSRVNSQIFLSIGALLVPLFVSVALTEVPLFEDRQADNLELFRPWQDAPADASNGANITPHHGFRPTNMQSTVSVATFVAYCLLLVALTRAPLFVVWTGIGLYLLHGGFLLLGGLKDWLLNEHVARALVWVLPLTLLFGIAGWSMGRRKALQPFAATFFAFFPLPFAFCLSMLAWYGAIEWLHASKAPDNLTINHWFMADGVAYFVLSILLYRSKSGFARFWAPFIMLLVPLHLTTPVNLLMHRGWHFFSIGGEDVTSYEFFALAEALVLIVIGTRLRVHTLAWPGLASLALFLWRATDRHFEQYLAWPTTLMLVGGIAMITSAVLLARRLGKRHEGIM